MNLPRLRFFHHEIHMEYSRRELGAPEVGGERVTACATEQPNIYYIIINFIIIIIIIIIIMRT